MLHIFHRILCIWALHKTPPASRGISWLPFFLFMRVGSWHFSPLQIFVPFICHCLACMSPWPTFAFTEDCTQCLMGCLRRCTQCELVLEFSCFLLSLGKHPGDSLLPLYIFIKHFAVWAYKSQFNNAIPNFNFLPVTMDDLTGWLGGKGEAQYVMHQNKIGLWLSSGVTPGGFSL